MIDDINIATEKALFSEGSTVDLMICKNCKFNKNGICSEINEKISSEDYCANWEEKIFDEEKDQLRNIYELIIKVLKKYCDLKEEYYSLIALWIIGTYTHKEFITYPYLFFNAMKGSGKSRLLKLILKLSNNGIMANNLSEAVLFRTAGQRTLGIDEFEHVGTKEKGLLRELLNSAYKKGTCVERAKKVYGDKGDEWVIERYDVYCPILMANISGMEEVLSDRCISLILEKSDKKQITRLLELFDTDLDILAIKRTFSVDSVSKILKNMEIGDGWNNYVLSLDRIDTIDTTHTTHTIDTIDIHTSFYIKIDKSGIDSRSLELFFPLFVISRSLGDDILDKTIETAKFIVNEKKDEDFMENRDVTFLNFIANSENYFQSIADYEFIKEKDILEKYKEWVEYDDKNEEFKWLKSHWIGRALKRLNLIVEKKRIAKGRMVRINFVKAKKQSELFKKENETEHI